MNDPEYKRTLKEVLSIAYVEPTLKTIYVEGIDDKLFIDGFLERQGVEDVYVGQIKDIVFPDGFLNNNKEKVIYLARQLQDTIHGSIPWLCIVDVDMDIVFGTKKSDLHYLSYTDYNSMELYLYNKNSIRKLFKNVCRITSELDWDSLLNSIGVVCRNIFFMHCVMYTVKKGMINFDKNISFNKIESKLNLASDDYWDKLIINNSLAQMKNDLRKQYEEYHDEPITDIRLEIRGQDLFHCLYYCAKQYKSSTIDEESFGHSFWLFVNHQDILNKNLFKRILAL